MPSERDIREKNWSVELIDDHPSSRTIPAINCKNDRVQEWEITDRSTTVNSSVISNMSMTTYFC